MTATLTHRLIDNWLTQDVIASVQKVCLAGVGAGVIAVTEGRKWFSALVRRGEEEKARVSHRAEEVIDGLQERLETIQTDVVNDVNKLEKAVQKFVTQELRRLDIPSRKDIQHLARQVEALPSRVEEIIRLNQAERTAMLKPGGKSEAEPQPAPVSTAQSRHRDTRHDRRDLEASPDGE